ncbi:formyltransferase family protein [Candidatus Pelagibacter bacterium]|nr:formyltransferase family protein [Candidatus Pelagibacter bacterium]
MQDIIVFLNGTRGIEVIKKLKEFGHGILTSVIPLKKKYDLVQKELKKLDTNCLRFDDVNDKNSILHLKTYKAKLFIIAGYSTIFKKELMNIPKEGTINLHAGRLPEYRGGSPLNWQIINGETKAVISVIKVEEGIDVGQVLQDQNILINTSSTIGDLHDQANKLFPQLVINIIDKFDKTGKFSGRIQNEKNAVYWHQRNDDDGHINFKKLEVNQANRLVRALTKPYPGAWAFFEKKKVRIFSTEFPRFDLRGVPGRICYVQNQGPYIICKDKALLIKEYLIENYPDMRLKHGKNLI